MALLEGKVAIVTGGGRGIGKAISLLFAKEGASIAVNDIDSAPAEGTCHKIHQLGSTAVVCHGDVTDNNYCDQLVAMTIQEFGKVDIIVNNAGYNWDTFIHKMPDYQWRAMLDIHATAPFRIIRAASSYFIDTAKREAIENKSRYRKIINISSLAGIRGNEGQVNYSAGKAAMIGLTKALAKELGRFGVNVNALALGMIRTRLTDTKGKGETISIHGHEIQIGMPESCKEEMIQRTALGRVGNPEEAAGAALFLASHLSDYVTGHVLVCSGGLML